MSALFKFKVVDRPDDSYYVTRWDQAVPVSVIADSKPEALTKVWALMGKAPDRRHWIASLLSVEPVPEQAEPARDG